MHLKTFCRLLLVSSGLLLATCRGGGAGAGHDGGAGTLGAGAGAPGPTGAAGIPGQTNGDAGTAAAGSSAGTTAATGVAGRNGASGTNGGNAGVTGAAGTAAAAGTTGTQPLPDGGVGSSVVQWGRFETSVQNTKTYADPFRGVTLNVTYTRPDGSHLDFWGFYDGGTTWRLRFMPDQVGTWTWRALFSDGAPGAMGSFQVVAGDIPGMISKDETNPLWFGFAGGKHRMMRSFHLGDKFFASNFPAAGRKAFLDWLQGQGYNMVGIGSHYLNRNDVGRGQGWNTPDLWDGPTRTLKPAEYQRMEGILDDLMARKIVVFPFAGFFGKSSDFPLDHADQELYLRYTLARVAPYWNIVMAVTGPEPLLVEGTAEYRNAMPISEISRLGTLIQTLNVFKHLLTVHNTTNDNAFKDQAWEDYTTLQGPKTLNRSVLSAGILGKHAQKPLYAYELLWPGNNVGHPVYSDTDTRKNGYVMIMSGATINFGDMNGNSSTGFSGSMDLADKIQSRHDIIKKVWDFFDTLELYRLSPHQNLLASTYNSYCLADPGHEYLVYLEAKGTVSVTVTGGPYHVEWVNAQNTTDVRAAGTTTTGMGLASPTDGDDWLLHLKP